jgi:hypothetical protein
VTFIFEFQALKTAKHTVYLLKYFWKLISIEMSETVQQLAYKGDLQQLQVKLLENKRWLFQCFSKAVHFKLTAFLSLGSI